MKQVIYPNTSKGAGAKVAKAISMVTNGNAKPSKKMMYSRISKKPISAGSYHDQAQAFIKGSKAQGRTVTREGSELIASKSRSGKTNQ